MSFLGDIAKQAASNIPGVGTYYRMQNILENAAKSTGNTYDYDWLPGVDQGNNTGTGLAGDQSRINFQNVSQNTGSPKDPGSPYQENGIDLGGVNDGGLSNGYSAADLAYFDDQIAQLQAQKDRISTGLTQGLTNLEDSYNRNVSDQNQKRSRALEDFGVQREDTIRGKDSALDKVNTNARVLADSLRRRLGMASGADSSAYQIAAPGAVARQASGERTDVLGSYGQNERNLATAEGRAKTDFEQLLNDLSAQRRTAESGLRSGILQQQNQVDASLADAARQRSSALGGGYSAARSASAPYQQGIADRNTQIDALFNQFRNPYSINEVKVDTPQLSNYLVDRAAVNANQQSGRQDPTAPYGPQLKNEDELNNIYA